MRGVSINSLYTSLCFLAVACLSLPLLAATPQAQAQGGDTQLLARIDSAARKINYSGLYVFQQGQHVQSLRITHMVDKGQTWEKLEVLDGKPQEIVRHNDDVQVYYPQTQTIVQQRRVQGDQFPGLLMGDHYEWQNHYILKRGQDERVAGHDCELIHLEPRDHLRYGHKLWADKKTGLLLKAQTLNERGDILEQVAFSEVKIHLPFDRHRVAPSWATQNWRVERQEIQPHAWIAEGWQFRQLPPGFRKQAELKRPKGDSKEGQANLGQVIFSDGLTALSVFVEPYNEQLHQQETLKNSGAAHILAKRVANFWVVIVGDAPAETIRKLAAGIEFKSVR
ncbi:MucB/RseB C-terminal domain-containing protein [Parvibium lacunae]|nr:MucB/RseB C-terminal domain-containing protein [Parvibium lacunae]